MNTKTSFIISCIVSVFPFFCFAQDKVEQQVEQLLSKMTLDEKIGQMNQLNYEGFSVELQNKIRKGEVGSILNVFTPEEVDKLQKIAIEESPNRIPLIIGRDVIHGFKTIFPIPLGQAASFDPAIAEKGARVAAVESRERGITWTFAPMLDISRDARWGRIAESLGEDPFLCGAMGAAMVRGFQGKDLRDNTAMAACIKHFVGYGAAEGGRDYNSTNIPPYLFRNVYLHPFKSAIDAGALTLMTSFNDNDGIPASGNKFLLKNILREEWKFDGFVVSDWRSISEMIPHGFAKDEKEAARISANAGLDMEMTSETYHRFLAELVKAGQVSLADIDNSVRNILRVKVKMNLFENPYIAKTDKSKLYAPEHLAAAREAAIKSAILLKNDGILPLKKSQKIAVFGPLADAPHDQLGTWVFDGEKSHTITPVNALQTEYKDVRYVYEPTLKFSRDKDTSDFNKAVQLAKSVDVSIVFVGEEAILSGEAHSLSNINLVGAQSELLKAVKSAGKPVVMVVIAGRPLTIGRDLPYADAVLYNFHPGTMGGPAILDLLYGKANPSGKLPVTFVNEVGQIPLYYNHNNTGRPAAGEEVHIDQIPLEAGQTSLGNTSFYLDSGKDPLFPFGFGLSYSNFEYSDLKLSNNQISKNDTLTVAATIKNTGRVKGEEAVQLYIRDLVGSIARPVKELKGFKKISLQPEESQVVEFKITAKDLAFYGIDMTLKAEAGDFNVWIGKNSQEGLMGKFSLTE